MHTKVYGDVRIHHNGGYDGDAVFVVNGKSMEIPMDAILRLVAACVRDRRISKLEDATDEELLYGMP